MQWGIYIHIPFCQQKCFYCDFPSFAGRERYMEDYTAALCQEIRTQGSCCRQKWGEPATVYIGGGTPTALPRELLGQIICTVTEVCLDKGSRPEFTVECNPGTVDADDLLLLRRNGISRLSFGVQSFDDVLLKAIGRIHTGAEAVYAFQLARNAGFDNISLDLMYGLPGQSLTQLQASVDQALSLEPEHLSIYGLQLEEGTVFMKTKQQGRLHLPTDEVTEQMYDYMTHTLPQHGYVRYEISNFARSGFASRHNLSYWQDVPYLGLGAAAHAYLDGQRWLHSSDIADYIEGIGTGCPVMVQEEGRSTPIAMEEFCFLALRTAVGISRAKFKSRFGRSLDSVYADVIARMKKKGFLTESDTGVRLTELGMKYGNWVFEEFLLDPDGICYNE